MPFFDVNPVFDFDSGLFWCSFCVFLSKSTKIGENGRFALSNFGAVTVTAEGPYDYGYFVSGVGVALRAQLKLSIAL